MKITLPLVALFFSLFSYSQTFTNSTGGNIPDNNTYVQFPINVSGLSSASLNYTSFGVESVKINLTHTYDEDLRIKLQSPDGNVFVLTSSIGGDGDDYTNTIFSDTANVSISNG